MAFDLNKIKKNIQKSADSLRQSVTEAAEKMPETVKEGNVQNSVRDLAKKGQNVFSSLRAKGEEAIAQQREKSGHQKEAVSDALQSRDGQEMLFSIRDSLRLIYSLMVVDGAVSDEERERLFEIGQELDPNFASYQTSLDEEGTGLLNKPSENEEDYYDNVHDHVSNIIHTAAVPKGNGLRGKILLWDLLSVAYSEGDYSAEEKRLLRFISKSVGVDHAVLLEMEQTMKTLLAIEAEENWLKNTDRPYAVVEERVNELADRKNTIMQGVQALLAD